MNKFENANYIESSGPPPRIRYSSTIVKENNRQFLYIFGGSGGIKHSSYWNDVWALDITTWTWYELCSIAGDVPVPRYGHTATLVPDDLEGQESPLESREGPIDHYKRLIVFGGKSCPPYFLQNDVYEFNLESLTWKKLAIKGQPPAPRYYHSASYIGYGNILVFGGRTGEGESSDVYILDLKQNQWIQPQVEGKYPTKRYQHSAFVNSTRSRFIVYGGINKMRALEDLAILDLDSMTWETLKAKNEMDFHTTRANEYGILVGDDRMLAIDFDLLQREQKLDYIEIYEDSYMWKSVNVKGDIPENSQFYTINSLGDQHIFMQIPKETSITLLHSDESLFHEGSLVMKKVPLNQVDYSHTLSMSDYGMSNVVTVECHHAGSKWFSIDVAVETSFSNLVKMINKKCRVLQYSFITAKIGQDYRNVTAETYPEIIRERTGLIRLYIAESVKADDMKKKRLDFLTHQAATLTSAPGTEHHELPQSSDLLESEALSINVADQDSLIHGRSKAASKSEVVLPLPKLYARPTKLSFLRRLHKKMKQFEARGFDATLLSRSNIMGENTPLIPRKKHVSKDHFSWDTFGITLLRLLFLPFYTVYISLFRFSAKAIGWLLLFSLLEMMCIALPIVATYYARDWYNREILGEGTIYAPVIVYFLLVLIVATIDGVWKNPTKLTKELAQYNVTLLQRLATNEYGERSATADDIMFAITSKEETTKDNRGLSFLTYIFSGVAAALHSVVTVIYLVDTHKLALSSKWYVHTIAISGILLNFVMMYILLFIMGCCITIYSRQLTHIQYFGALLARQNAEALDLPTLPLNSIENAMAWMKIRSFIRAPQFLPLTTANVVLGYAIIVGVLLWIIVAIQIFTSKIILNTVMVLVMFNAALMAVYIIMTLWLGAHINAWLEKHVSMLYKEQLKLSLQIQQHKEEESTGNKKHAILQEIHQMKGCKEVLHILASIIEKQENSFSILGFSISETATKAILGLTISVTVAVIARIGLDLTEEGK